VAGFAVAVNNGSAEPRYYVDHLRRQHVQLQQQQHQQQHQPPRYPMQMQMLSGHVPTLAAKEAVLEPPPRRDDLVYVHCATTEDEEVAEDEEDEPRGLTRSRSWLCCPGDRRPDKTVPIQVEVDNKDRQNAVSSLCSPSRPPFPSPAGGGDRPGCQREKTTRFGFSGMKTSLVSASPPPAAVQARDSCTATLIAFDERLP